MNNAESSMIGMRPKDTIKLEPSHWTKHIQKKPYYPRMDYIDTLISLANNMKTKKGEQQNSFGEKIRID